MNRQQRRASGNKQKQPTYNVTPSQLQAMVMERIEGLLVDEVRSATAKTLAVIVIELHDVFGFGLKRIQQLIAKVNYTLDGIDRGHVSIQDIYEWCKEYGVDFGECPQETKKEEMSSGKNTM